MPKLDDVPQEGGSKSHADRPNFSVVYDWLVVGAGPAGIAAVGKLLDNGVPPNRVCWVDPEFRAGDLGAKWLNVSSNTKVRIFKLFFRACRSFEYQKDGFALETFGDEETCLLSNVAKPLQSITAQLMLKVATLRTTVTGIRMKGGIWHATSALGDVGSRNVVLAIGAEPSRMRYQAPCISLDDALDPDRLRQALEKDGVVGVFGSSHSAIMAIHNLIDAGASRVINFYRSPLRYAVDYGDWILYDNTGLKGVTADWARGQMGKLPDERLLRVKSDRKTVERYLPLCTKVVYGVGFKARDIPVDGVDLTKYDRKLGTIGPGLFGCGIAFPERVVDREGNVEYNVGMWKFMQYLDRVVPMWIELSSRRRKSRRG